MIVEATDTANQILAKLNMDILNCESRIKELPKNLKEKHLSRLNKYQLVVSQLIDKYQGRHEKVTENEIKQLKKFDHDKVSVL
jgi:hypothetical protein